MRSFVSAAIAAKELIIDEESESIEFGEFAKELIARKQDLGGIERVCICDGAVNDENIDQLLAVLPFLANARILSVCNNALSGDSARKIAAALRKAMPHLNIFDFGGNCCGDDTQWCVDLISSKPTLKNMVLRSNEIANAKDIADAIVKSPHLLSIDLENNNITSDGAILLATAVKSNRNFSTINLRFNDISATATAALNEVFQNHPSLIEVNLSGNDWKRNNINK